MTQYRHTQSAYFVRYRFVRNKFVPDGKFSETRLKLGTKCRANLFLRGGSVDEKSILETPSAKSGMFDTLPNRSNKHFCDFHTSLLMLSFQKFLMTVLLRKHTFKNHFTLNKLFLTIRHHIQIRKNYYRFMH